MYSSGSLQCVYPSHVSTDPHRRLPLASVLSKETARFGCITYSGYIGIVEKKMETTIMGYIGVIGVTFHFGVYGVLLAPLFGS